MYVISINYTKFDAPPLAQAAIVAAPVAAPHWRAARKII